MNSLGLMLVSMGMPAASRGIHLHREIYFVRVVQGDSLVRLELTIIGKHGDAVVSM